MATVGKNILDNLTTGMYSDSKVIYREYIQNACDQIDLAMKMGILAPDEGCVDILIDDKKRYISIRDNATGVKHDLFAADLGDIANSNKEIGKNKGFRGIGRLCGLAYCKMLKFTTSYKGEKVKSSMICDAQMMRKMLYENVKYTLDEIWDTIVSFEEEPEQADAHYFEVELFNINPENTDLLNKSLIREYLSFVAPVPYSANFIFSEKIYAHAQKLDYHIDEYSIRVNGAEIFKEYTTRLKDVSGSKTKTYDEISSIYLHDFTDESGNLIAWMWIGLSRFEKQIPKVNQMRGIRLRSANIQIGGDDVLQELFKESRGNYYFVGEVFAVDDGLIPNSQRDYFNENETRVVFEDLLSAYFSSELHTIYYTANNIKNAFKRQEEYLGKVQEYKKKSENHGFVDSEEKKKLLFEMDKSKDEAEKARKTIQKYQTIARADEKANEDEKVPLASVYRNIDKKFNAEQLTEKAFSTTIPNAEQEDNGKKYVTTGMSKLSRSERKLVIKILTIITSNAPKDVAETIIEKIKEEMR